MRETGVSRVPAELQKPRGERMNLSQVFLPGVAVLRPYEENADPVS